MSKNSVVIIEFQNLFQTREKTYCASWFTDFGLEPVDTIASGSVTTSSLEGVTEKALYLVAMNQWRGVSRPSQAQTQHKEQSLLLPSTLKCPPAPLKQAMGTRPLAHGCVGHIPHSGHSKNLPPARMDQVRHLKGLLMQTVRTVFTFHVRIRTMDSMTEQCFSSLFCLR